VSDSLLVCEEDDFPCENISSNVVKANQAVSLKQGCTQVPNKKEKPQNSRLQRGDMKQVSC